MKTEAKKKTRLSTVPEAALEEAGLAKETILAAIQLHHRDEICILHPAELEHSIRNDGVAVPLDDSKFHNISPLHSAHLHFYRWG